MGIRQEGDYQSLCINKARSFSQLRGVEYAATVGGYPIVDTNQTIFYSNDAIIDELSQGDAFYGQDAQFDGNQPSYTDHVTGLMWTQDPGDKMTWTEAVTKLKELNENNYLGYSDCTPITNYFGKINGETVDAHGSGAQRSDPKTGSKEDYPAPDPKAPQGMVCKQ